MKDAKTHVINYFNRLTELFKTIKPEAIETFIDLIQRSLERDAQIFFIGNGGSAATASHFANDLGGLGYRVQSLTDNVATITAIGNDFGYENIFVNQLQNHLRRGDLVVAISASGNSPSIIEAIHFANKVGAYTVGLTGFDGGELRQICWTSVHVPTHKGEYGPVEDLHMIFDHLIMSYLSTQKLQISGAV